MYSQSILTKIGLSLDIDPQRLAPGFASNVDYIFTKDGETRAVVEVNSPDVFKSLIQNLLTIHDAFEVKIQTGATTTAENVINKVSLSYPHPWIRIYFLKHQQKVNRSFTALPSFWRTFREFFDSRSRLTSKSRQEPGKV